MERMRELVEKLNLAAKEYYAGNTSHISDFEYDKLYDELSHLEATTGIVLANSPTLRVGYEVMESLTKVRHESPMLSLDKTKDIDKLKSFLGENKGLLSWKMDGLTVVLKYLNGTFTQAVTRGNGEIGEDITHNAKVFKNIPSKIQYKGEFTIRGEAIITFENFKKINEHLDVSEQYKNPRNLCSGTVRQLNSEIVANRSVSFYAFTLVNTNRELDEIFLDSKEQKLKWLISQGFEVADYRTVTAETIEQTVGEFKDRVPKNFYATDGLVLTYDSISFSDSLGRTSKFPRDSIAFKWADEIARTKLIRVDWNTSRTGLINPIAIFEPVELEGTTVNKASLHNVSIFEELKLGYGDEISVYKANMIIPQVAENFTKSASVQIPAICEVCKSETEIIQAREGRALYCKNPNCSAQLVSGLSHFASRDAMNIEGLSEATIEKFVEREFLKNYADIFELEKFENDIKTMEGFGQKSFKNLIDAINKSKKVSMPNFINGLGISQVGLSNAKLLCKHYNYNFEEIRAAKSLELEEIHGFGEIIARAIEAYFVNVENSNILDRALEHLEFETVELSEEQSLTDKNFVITGDLLTFSNRKELQELIEKLGGKVSGSVSSKTTFLINNDSLSNSSKNKKAKELDVEIITESDFRQRFL